jgi:hypothetical protein
MSAPVTPALTPAQQTVWALQLLRLLVAGCLLFGASVPASAAPVPAACMPWSNARVAGRAVTRLDGQEYSLEEALTRLSRDCGGAATLAVHNIAELQRHRRNVAITGVVGIIVWPVWIGTAVAAVRASDDRRAAQRELGALGAR